MQYFCAVNRHGLVIGIGNTNDDALSDCGLQLPSLWRIYPCEWDVVCCYAGGCDVMVRIEQGVAVI